MRPLTPTPVDVWRTSSRITAYLIERLPAPLWDATVPGAPRRTVRSICVHFHNARARWIRTLGSEHGIKAPPLLDPRRATRRAIVTALGRSAKGIEAVIALGIARGGGVPPSKGYVWRNLPLDVGHVVAYFVAHEAHHRGQIVMLARELGHRVPRDVVNGLWQWTSWARQAKL